MAEEIKAGAVVKVEKKTQKVVSKGHLPKMRPKTVQLKNGLQLKNKGGIQNIRLGEDKDFASPY